MICMNSYSIKMITYEKPKVQNYKEKIKYLVENNILTNRLMYFVWSKIKLNVLEFNLFDLKTNELMERWTTIPPSYNQLK